MKKALITGVSGQDGAYLSKLLLDKGYEVEGIIRRNASQEFYRLKHLNVFNSIRFHEIELTEKYQLEDLFKSNTYDEIYNLASQSFVGTSFISPFYTLEVNTISVLNILESLRRFAPETKFYQASTSEMFGKVQEKRQSENTQFYPRSPYGISKLASHWLTINYREAYKIFGVSGILFNHESPLRGNEFITKKISSGVANIERGEQELISVGNLNSSRDWGFAGDYVQAMHAMLQLENPHDFVIGTGESHSIRDLIELAFKCINREIIWKGEGLDEVALDKNTEKVLVKVSEEFFRPSEVDVLLADNAKAKKILNWRPTKSFQELIRLMVDFDLSR